MKGASNFDKLCHQVYNADGNGRDYIGKATEGNFCDIAQCCNVPGGIFCEDGACYQKKVWERLKAYEDKRLEPEEVLPKDKVDEIALKLMRLADLESLCNYTRLRELAEADKDGRLAILPFRGDADIVLRRNGIAFKPGYWNIHLTAFAENQLTPSGKKVALLDRVALFDLSEVQESMEGKKDG